MTATLLETAVDPGPVYREAVAFTPKPGVRYGSTEPRICTPPLRPLTPETSLGYSAIEFATEVLGVDLFPWQRSLLIRMLELREDGSLRFKTVVVLVARQNGKSTVSQVLALWMMLYCGWPLVLGTAQDLETAEEVWEEAVGLLEDDEELATLIDKVIKVNGKKALVLKAPAGQRRRYKVKAANRRAGRGFAGNLILLDELREHQNWLAWGAITKTTMAQALALVLCLSNAGDVTSVVLRYLRKLAHEVLGDPDGIVAEDEVTGPTAFDLGQDDDTPDEDIAQQDADTLGLFEWSTEKDRSKWDRDGWAQGNPSMGHIPPLEANLASACKIDPEWVFRTECLCQWPDGTLSGPFEPGAWEQGQNPVVELPDGTVTVGDEDRLVGPLKACIDMSHDRSQTYIVVAGHRADGWAQVEVVAGRYGSDWVKEWLEDPRRVKRITAVTGQKNGAPISGLMKELAEDEDFPIPVEDWAGGDLTAAWGDFSDAVRDVTVRHNVQPVLDAAAAAGVTRILGDRQILDRAASPVDVAPLMAACGALWLLKQRDDTPAPPPPPPAVLTTDDTDDEGETFGSADLATAGF